MPQGYYQLGGFRSPLIEWCLYDEKRLSQMIAGDTSPLRAHKGDSKNPIELILGITRVGTSHLLLTEAQTRQISQVNREKYPRARPRPPSDFESLSPMYFRTPDELVKKLGLLKYKSMKGRTPRDNSQANRQYVSGEDGVARGRFEHCRLLYQLLHNKIDPIKYSLSEISWIRSIRVCSFVFNVRPNDTRPAKERIARPSVLDCGLSEATIPDIETQAGSSVHLMFSNNLYINQGSNKQKFNHGITEVLDTSVLSTRLQEFFKNHVHMTSQPMILLVHDEGISRNVLKNCGIDTSLWESGIKSLLGFESPEVKSETGLLRSADPRARYSSGDPTRLQNLHSPDEYEQRRTRTRSRSRSPYRSNPYSSGSLPYGDSSQPRSPPRRNPNNSGRQVQHHRSTYAPVYIIDVKQLYTKMMQTEVSSQSIAKIAQHLGLYQVLGWCAGNESTLIIDVWRSMISGPAIDEQRAARMSSSNSQEAPPSEAADSDNDSDKDPNDMIQVVTPLISTDSDSDYGQSDSE